MANVLIDESILQGWAETIREKTGSTEAMLPSAMLERTQNEWGSGGGVSWDEILPESTLPFSEIEGSGFYGFGIPDASLYPIVEGKNYKAVWDGTVYHTQCKTLTATEDGETVALGQYIGNADIYGTMLGAPDVFEDTGEPFLVIGDSSTGIILTTSTDGTHAVQIFMQTGGGSSDLVKYVTFMSEDGTEELHVKPTIAGDDCVNVISKGLLEKPTKTSTAQYSYTYSGWSLTPGGSADSNALKNITEDRVLYASFTSAIRYYDIVFDLGDGATETLNLAYGSTINYEPTKKGYTLLGWQPALATVTGSATYVAQWQEGLKFSSASWEEIAEVAENGTARSVFAVGDEKIVRFGSWDVPVMIVGFNHDTLADGSGRKAGISIIAKSVFPIETTRLYLKTYAKQPTCVDDDYLKYVPDDLKSVIKPVLKECESALTLGTDTEDVTFNYLFPISFYELGFTRAGWTADETICNLLGEPYEYYSNMGLTATSDLNRAFKKSTTAETGYKYNINAVLRGEMRSTSGTGRTYPELILQPGGSVSYQFDGSSSLLDTRFYRPFGFCI